MIARLRTLQNVAWAIRMERRLARLEMRAARGDTLAIRRLARAREILDLAAGRRDRGEPPA